MIVIARKTGRLGNRLKLFSHFIAFSCEYDIPISNPSFYKYAHLFEGTRHSGLACHFPPHTRSRPASELARGIAYQSLHASLTVASRLNLSRWPLRVHSLELQERCQIDAPEFVDMARRGTVFVRGYRYRCDSLVQKHHGVIRDYFRLPPKFAEQVDEVASNLRRDDSLVIGVHIRHGDYATYAGGKHFFTIKAYASIMRRLQNLFANRPVRFLVCSDASVTPGDFTGLDVTINGRSPIVDLYSLAECDRIIGPWSTFTQWSSFYGDVPLLHISDAEQVIREEDFRHQHKDFERTPSKAA